MGLQRQERGQIESKRFRGDEGVTLYEYGWPSGGTNEPNVAEQWLFDETSGNIVGEVNSITLTPNGTPTYNQTLTGLFANISPGIDYGANSGHQNGSAQSDLDLGTNDFVIECWFTYVATGNFAYMLDTKAGGAADDEGYNVFYNSTPEIILEIVASDTTRVQYFKSMSGSVTANQNHKLRIVGDRSGNVEFFIDGSSLGTSSMSSHSGKSIAASLCHIGQRVTDASYFPDKLIELRVTIGNTTNNSGGPGGG